MIDYIFRFILCSCLFISIYYFILQNEKMYRFNRYYLLFSILASLFIPTFKFENKAVAFEKAEVFVSTSTIYVTDAIETLDQEVVNFTLNDTVIGIYAIISLILLFRFLISNWLLIRKANQSEQVSLKKATLALTLANHPIHSYLNYIFITKQAYENGMIDQDIIDHELAHITQRHSLDLLFIEFLFVFSWFNPVLYLYRKAIRLNHEFLADEAVINNHHDISYYMKLVINQTAYAEGVFTNSHFSSTFNYLKTKKRLLMMTRKRVSSRIFFKKGTIIPLVLISVLLFSQNPIAQDVKDAVTLEDNITPKLSISDEELQHKFDELLKPYLKYKNDSTYALHMNFDHFTKEQLISTYLNMSKSQQAKQIVRVSRKSLPKKMKFPTKKEFEKWKDPKGYGVWLNGKQISNDLLDNYSNTDFSTYYVSILAKNAKNYGKHVYQVNLQTNDDFEMNYEKIKVDTTLRLWLNVKYQPLR